MNRPNIRLLTAQVSGYRLIFRITAYVEVPRQRVYREEREKRDAQIPDEGPRHQARCEREKTQQEAGNGQPEEFQDKGAG